MVLNLKHILFESFPVTMFTLQRQVGHELHLNSYGSFALTFFASPPRRIEGEMGCRVTHLLRQLLIGKQFSYLVVGLDISHRI
ncbi:hypothetical protein SDC9_181503 [bioreactor metagenome]|uniref:Uncharacterized protein n=1 Tax=bioreactor metagenome TaxID=1076179 RepID=A0A645H4R3_9ZZZZ